MLLETVSDCCPVEPAPLSEDLVDAVLPKNLLAVALSGFSDSAAPVSEAELVKMVFSTPVSWSFGEVGAKFTIVEINTVFDKTT